MARPHHPGRRTVPGGNSQTPLNHVLNAVMHSNNLSDRDKRQIRITVRTYKRAKLTLDQAIVTASAVYAYVQMLRLRAAMDSLKVQSKEYRGASYAYIRYNEAFKKLMSVKNMNEKNGKQKRETRLPPMRQPVSEPGGVQDDDGEAA